MGAMPGVGMRSGKRVINSVVFRDKAGNETIKGAQHMAINTLDTWFHDWEAIMRVGVLGN